MKKLLFPLLTLLTGNMAASAQSTGLKEKSALNSGTYTVQATNMEVTQTSIKVKEGDTLFIKASGKVDPGNHVSGYSENEADYFFGPEGAPQNYSAVRVQDNLYNHFGYLPAMRYGETVILLRDMKKVEEMNKKQGVKYKDAIKGYQELPISTNPALPGHKMWIVNKEDIRYSEKDAVMDVLLDINDINPKDNKGSFTIQVEKHALKK